MFLNVLRSLHLNYWNLGAEVGVEVDEKGVAEGELGAAQILHMGMGSWLEQKKKKTFTLKIIFFCPIQAYSRGSIKLDIGQCLYFTLFIMS